MSDIDDFAQLLHQVSELYLGVVDVDRDAYHARQLAASDDEGLHAGTAAAKQADNTVDGTWPVVDKHDQHVGMHLSWGSIGLTRPSGRDIFSHGLCSPLPFLRSCW